jgi:signal recognition particle subunit SRP72
MSLPSLSSLLKQTSIDDDEQVLRAADAALKSSPSDLDAQYVKLIALLKLDRYDAALKTLNAGGEKLKERSTLEHAYALYKSGNPKAAVDLAQKGTHRGSKHVEAQARYRSEDFAGAAALYKELARTPDEDAIADLRINSGAVDAQLEWAGQGHLVQKKKPEREDLDAFETAYNAACGSIARGELAQGEVLLKRASGICSSLEDMSEEEKQAELLPIIVQQVYVLSRLGRTEEAEELAKTASGKAIPDPVTQYIAQVNGIATTSDINPYLAQRLVSNDLETFRPDYPFQFQSAVLERNRYASGLQALKYDGTAKSTNHYLDKASHPTTDVILNSKHSISVVNAAAHARGRTGKEALKHILPVLRARPTDIGLLLTIVQLYVLTGNPASATSLLATSLDRLEKLSGADQDARFAPGLVAAAVSLYIIQGRKGSAHQELAKAASYWRSKSKHRPTGYIHLFKTAGSALLHSQTPEHLQLAKDIFDELHTQAPEDRYAAAGIIAASPDTASSQEIASLTPIDRLIGKIDAEALENAGVAQPLSASGVPSSRKRPAEDTKPKKAKKIRKNKLPRDYDPNKKPDPERWLPLRDRSSYRPKGKKAKARQALFSQGAVATDNESSRPATPGADVVQQKLKAGGGAQNKKKKGKGGKW